MKFHIWYGGISTKYLGQVHIWKSSGQGQSHSKMVVWR